MGTQQELQPHAHLDLNSRRLKATKIERLLDLESIRQPIHLLEIGTGSGGIAHYFATHPELQFDVTAVDVVDQRQTNLGYRFFKVTGTSLPFSDTTFDVVLSNHVIEHVGSLSAQRHHLSEIHRVMKPNAIGYLATPNRWQIVEPHYHLAFLSWLPRRLRTPYLRLRKNGHDYDCEPLSVRQLESLLREARYTYCNLGTRAIRQMHTLEGTTSWSAAVAATLPDVVLDRLTTFVPTLIYLLRRSDDVQ